MVDPALVTSIVAWITFVYWQQARSAASSSREWYEFCRNRIPLAPPGWIYGVAWFILYGLISASAVVYFSTTQPQYGVATLVLYIVNIFLNKFWSVVFFDGKASGTALLIALLMLFTEIAILVLLGLSVAWVPFGLFAPYVVWTAFAIYLNFQWWRLACNEQYERSNSGAVVGNPAPLLLQKRLFKK